MTGAIISTLPVCFYGAVRKFLPGYWHDESSSAFSNLQIKV